MFTQPLLAFLFFSLTTAFPQSMVPSLTPSPTSTLDLIPVIKGMEGMEMVKGMEPMEGAEEMEDIVPTPTATIAYAKFTTTQVCTTECVTFMNDCGVSYGGCYIDCSGGQDVPTFEAPACPPREEGEVEEVKEEVKEKGNVGLKSLDKETTGEVKAVQV